MALILFGPTLFGIYPKKYMNIFGRSKRKIYKSFAALSQPLDLSSVDSCQHKVKPFLETVTLTKKKVKPGFSFPTASI
jgi:hypothetical protein